MRTARSSDASRIALSALAGVAAVDADNGVTRGGEPVLDPKLTLGLHLSQVFQLVGRLVRHLFRQDTLRADAVGGLFAQAHEHFADVLNLFCKRLALLGVRLVDAAYHLGGLSACDERRMLVCG